MRRRARFAASGPRNCACVCRGHHGVDRRIVVPGNVRVLDEFGELGVVEHLQLGEEVKVLGDAECMYHGFPVVIWHHLLLPVSMILHHLLST